MENKYNHLQVPPGLLILFFEKALTLMHMETHLNNVGSVCYELLGRMTPYLCATSLFLYLIPTIVQPKSKSAKNNLD